MPRSAPIDLARLEELAAAQEGIVSRLQLSGLGADKDVVRRRLASGRWQPLGPRVVSLTTGWLTREQRLWVGVLHAGPLAVLGAATAAELGGLSGLASDVVHVAVPHGIQAGNLRVRSQELQVVVRQSRPLRRADDPERLIHPALAPPRLRLAPAVIDAASQAGSADRTRLFVIAAVQQRLLRPADLREVVETHQRLRRRQLILEAVGDVEGGIHSLPERAWTMAIRRYGLPEPARQVAVQRANGRWYLDSDFQPWNVSVEVNGVQHLSAATARVEEHRRNVLAIGGRLVITVSSHTVRYEPGSAVLATASALLARGWTPPPQVRARLERLAHSMSYDLLTGDRLVS